MNIHFIAIGGSAMHNLAIALHGKKYKVTGSDDQLFEPSRTRLGEHGLLPETTGWFPEKISRHLDAVILGMHAREDNPELVKAHGLGIRIYSYPEYIYEQSRDKQRVVIGGSHGKTTITAMVMHVLREAGRDFDYLAGARTEGFDTMVKISDAPLIVIEGDEYLSSPIDRRPKFHWYSPQVALLTGIAWDHINVFPTFEDYLAQFAEFIRLIPEGGLLIYNMEDDRLRALCETAGGVERRPYATPDYVIREGTTFLLTHPGEVPLRVFGRHNLQNIMAARSVCNALGVDDTVFYRAISTFRGAANRLELIRKNERTAVFRDFAHAPSKLRATVQAVKEQFPDRSLMACMELHTFSSLNERFLTEYHGTMDAADRAIVYFNPKTIGHKKLKPITPEQVRSAFGKEDLRVYTDSEKLVDDLKKSDWDRSVLLLMTSGNFDGIDAGDLTKIICG